MGRKRNAKYPKSFRTGQNLVGGLLVGHVEKDTASFTDHFTFQESLEFCQFHIIWSIEYGNICKMALQVLYLTSVIRTFDVELSTWLGIYYVVNMQWNFHKLCNTVSTNYYARKIMQQREWTIKHFSLMFWVFCFKIGR